MAYDEVLADRVRQALEGRLGLTERKMFGGIAWMLEGNMCVGVLGEDLMVRVGPDGWEDALDEPHVRPMDFTGRPLKGYVYVAPTGCASDEALLDWTRRGAEFAATLPPKA
jgi:TfoX/Sxy family transcriptional regulator of competence genes